MSFAGALAVAIEWAGVKVASSVPDNWLAPVIEALIASKTVIHAPAAREEDALGICCGAAPSGDGRFASCRVPVPLGGDVGYIGNLLRCPHCHDRG